MTITDFLQQLTQVVFCEIDFMSGNVSVMPTYRII